MEGGVDVAAEIEAALIGCILAADGGTTEEAIGTHSVVQRARSFFGFKERA
jgi:hypothetical protein